MDLQAIKQRFEIIGNSPGLNRAIEVAVQVAPTDLSVLVTGESGVGKEIFPQIIHQFSSRKHGKYIAVNCGAIPEGTIDSELFGHEKAGEFIRVGSSKVIKTNVRVIAATNLNLPKAIEEGQFREDLYYRLNTVPIIVLPLRERSGDINLLFRKFARDFAEKYRMPPVRLDEDARAALDSYRWPGNIRQLKNVTEQISIIEQDREISGDVLRRYLPNEGGKNLPALLSRAEENQSFSNEREILYKVLFDMKNDMNDLKKLVIDLMENRDAPISGDQAQIIRNLYHDTGSRVSKEPVHNPIQISHVDKENIQDTEEFVEESLSLADKEIELIKKALDKHRGKRKYAAQELGISERTLYRKIKEYDIKG